MSASTPLPLDSITHRIQMLRRQKVLLDSDLAALYNVPTKRFNEQIKRNLERFPADFMDQLTEEEWKSLMSQIARRAQKPSATFLGENVAWEKYTNS